MARPPQQTERFMWAVQALASPAETQLRLYPDFVAFADELALEYEETWGRYQDTAVSTATPAQIRAMVELDRQLEEMSGPENLSLWDTEALFGAPEWQQVRRLAQAVLHAMEWPRSPPPFDRGALYGLLPDD